MDEPFVMKKSDSKKKKVIEVEDLLKKEKKKPILLDRTVISGIHGLNTDKTMMLDMREIEFEKEVLDVSDLLIKKNDKTEVISIDNILTTYDDYEDDNKSDIGDNKKEISKISSLYKKYKETEKVKLYKEYEEENTVNIDDDLLSNENYLDVEIEFEVKALLDLIKYNKLDQFDTRLEECQKNYDSNVFLLIRYMFEGYVKD